MAEEKNNVRARFYADALNGDVVELRIAGDPFQSTSLQKVSPDHVRQFPREWDAYQQGKPTVDHGGTPLALVPGFHPSMTTALALAGVHNAEQMASLSDGNLNGLGIGLGARGMRDGARSMLANKDKDDEIARLRAQLADKDKPKDDHGDKAKGDKTVTLPKTDKAA